ncbi:MAG: ankyrin repeat domain-containing protein [Bacilli bacterium]
MRNPISKIRVKQWIVAAHMDLKAVKKLYYETPSLIHSNYDWGNGEWESAIDAASHTGQIDIVKFLLDKGAHPTIFSAAVLGDIELVTIFLNRQPQALYAEGPHGISLLDHVQIGGPGNDQIYNYLKQQMKERV